MKSYILASNKPWHVEYFILNRDRLPGDWAIATCSKDLSSMIAKTNPKYVFFPHWSDIVTDEILDQVECVCFHMTDLPFGRGGSPLQNLISRGLKSTKITSFKMTHEIDAGPIYMKCDLSLAGTAFEIFKASAPICFHMMQQIVLNEPIPTEQGHEPVVFKRRKKTDSKIHKLEKLEELFDHIRMLDAPGYPKAYIIYDNFYIKFYDARFDKVGVLSARVDIKNVK